MMNASYPAPPARMPLAEVLHGIPVRARRGPDVLVARIVDDSRVVGPGDLFVALSGHTVDGHGYVEEAARAGASAVLATREADFPGTLVVVDDTAWALGVAAANRLGNPGRHLGLVGITGTNGKTTTTFLLESIFDAFGGHPGVIGTVSYRFAGETRKAPFTTPTAPALQALLSEMVLSGCTHAVMEVSSHALWLKRVAGLDFDVAGFTNLTQDHLDLHGNMEAYRDAKRLLFTRHLKHRGCAVLWWDDPSAPQMVQGYPGRVVRVSRAATEAEVLVESTRQTLGGIEARLVLHRETLSVRSGLVGDHNVQNIALAAAMAWAAGVDAGSIVRGVERLAVVPGRLERVCPGSEVAVLVDYAHTPDALAHALSALRPLCDGRLICVFGCGGDRDALKRPLMGAMVARGADLAIVTSDNPRSEDPLAIIDAILEGIAGEGIGRVSPGDLCTAERAHAVMPDRRSAIFTAIQAARPGDVVLVAGKGHEDYQILGDTRIHFDDREESRAALAARQGS